MELGRFISFRQIWGTLKDHKEQLSKLNAILAPPTSPQAVSVTEPLRHTQLSGRQRKGTRLFITHGVPITRRGS